MRRKGLQDNIRIVICYPVISRKGTVSLNNWHEMIENSYPTNAHFKRFFLSESAVICILQEKERKIVSNDTKKYTNCFFIFSTIDAFTEDDI